VVNLKLFPLQYCGLLIMLIAGTLVDAILGVQRILKDSETPQNTELILLLPLLITNFVATISVAYRTWSADLSRLKVLLSIFDRSHYHSIRRNLESSCSSSRKMYKILLLVIESGLVYCVIWVG